MSRTMLHLLSACNNPTFLLSVLEICGIIYIENTHPVFKEYSQWKQQSEQLQVIRAGLGMARDSK